MLQNFSILQKLRPTVGNRVFWKAGQFPAPIAYLPPKRKVSLDFKARSTTPLSIIQSISM